MTRKDYTLKGTPSVQEFMKEFKDDKTALDFIIKHIYPNGEVVCPRCGCTDNIVECKYTTGIYGCFHCGKSIPILNGTIFEQMEKHPKNWLYVIYRMFVSRKGISTEQLSRETHYSNETIRKLRRRLQLAMSNYDLEPFQGIIEMDEGYIGGSNHGRYSKEQEGLGQKKFPVFGIYEVYGKRVYSYPAVPNELGQCLTGKQIKTFIDGTIKEGSTIVTDEFKSYNFLNKSDSKYKHETVNHNDYQYKNSDGFTTNGIEGYWSLVKKHYYSTHQFFAKKWAHLYLAEIDFRYNHQDWKNALDDILYQGVLFPQVIDIRNLGRFGNKTYDLNDYKMILPKCFDDIDLNNIKAEDILLCKEPVYGILKIPYSTRKKLKYKYNTYPSNWRDLGMVEYGTSQYKDYRNNTINTLEDVKEMIKDATKHKDVNGREYFKSYKRKPEPKEQRNTRIRKNRIRQRYNKLPVMLQLQIKEEYPNIFKVSNRENTFEIQHRIGILLRWYNKKFAD